MHTDDLAERVRDSLELLELVSDAGFALAVAQAKRDLQRRPAPRDRVLSVCEISAELRRIGMVIQ